MVGHRRFHISHIGLFLPRGGGCSILYLPDFGCHALSCVVCHTQVQIGRTLGSEENDTFFCAYFCVSGWRQGGWSWSVSKRNSSHGSITIVAKLLQLQAIWLLETKLLQTSWPTTQQMTHGSWRAVSWLCSGTLGPRFLIQYQPMYWTDLNPVKECDDSMPKKQRISIGSILIIKHRWHLTFFKALTFKACLNSTCTKSRCLSFHLHCDEGIGLTFTILVAVATNTNPTVAILTDTCENSQRVLALGCAD